MDLLNLLAQKHLCPIWLRRAAGLLGAALLTLGGAEAALAQAPVPRDAKEANEPAARAPEGAQELFERGFYFENGLKKLDEAIAIYRRVSALAGDDRELAARAQIRVALCERQRGRDMEAIEVLQGVVEGYADLPEVQKEAQAAINDAGAARRILRIYDCGMLVQEGKDAGPAPHLALDERRSAGSGGVGGASLTFEGDAAPGVAIPPDRLIALVRSNIAPDTWESERARLEIDGTRLFVVQTPEVHAEVEAYLAQLRAARGRLVTIEATLAVVDGALVRGLRPGALLASNDAAALDQALRTPGKARVISRPRASVLNGQLAQVHAVRTRRYQGEFSVNQTGTTPVVSPEIRTGQEGIVFAARPTLVEDGGSLLLEVTLSGAAWKESIQRETQYGTLELPVYDLADVRTSLLLPSGATAVAAILTTDTFNLGGSPLAGGECLVLCVRAKVSALAQEGTAGPTTKVRRPLRTYNVALLTKSLLRREEGLFGRRTEVIFDDEADPDPNAWGRPISPDVLVELIRGNIAPESWSSSLHSIELVSAATGELVVVQTAEVHAQIRAYLATLRSERTQLLSLDLYTMTLDDGAYGRLTDTIQASGPEAGTIPLTELASMLAGGWPGARLSRQVSAAALNGQWVRLGQARQRCLVTALERCSGGTGQVVEAVTDPVVEAVAEGYEVQLCAKAVPGGKLVMASVELASTKLEGRTEAKSIYGTLDLVTSLRENPRAELTFPLDRALVVHVGQGLQGIEERSVTVLRVRPQEVLGGK